MFQGLEHTAIASPDPRKLAQWYVDHLEFKLCHVYEQNHFVRAENGTVLEIIPSEGPRADQKMKDPGIRHLAIAVDDFDAAHQRLKQSGIRMVTEPMNLAGNRLVHFLDADGNLLHLIHRQTPLP